jgi:glyoxylase-like metal-dependent hydrolase (beta-lactamase superfamily II)
MSSYTGNVETGGAPDVRDLPGLRISKLSVGPMDNNAYLLECLSTGDLLLIDAANEAPRLLELIGDRTLSTVVTTHQHMDHWVALEEVVAATGASALAHPDDAEGLPIPTSPVVDGSRISIGDCELEVIHLVGHTPGSIALLYRDPAGTPHLWTGDSLFPGGVGNTHDDPEAFASLIGDVERKLFAALPDETWFYPGHGKDSTVGAERPSVAEWRARGW